MKTVGVRPKAWLPAGLGRELAYDGWVCIDGELMVYWQCSWIDKIIPRTITLYLLLMVEPHCLKLVKIAGGPVPCKITKSREYCLVLCHFRHPSYSSKVVIDP
jgi:hypothetical protein